MSWGFRSLEGEIGPAAMAREGRAGGLAARFTRRGIWFASVRQLAFGAVAIAAITPTGTEISVAQPVMMNVPMIAW